MFGVLGGLLAEETGEDVAFRDIYDRRELLTYTHSRAARQPLLTSSHRPIGALQEYVILVAQHPGGGLRDKPGKGPDGYHTCYNLAGLSAAQHKYTLPSSAVDKCRESFVSPFAGSRVVELEKKEVEMILDEGESEESAEQRMREVWARSFGWTEVEKELVGGEENEVVSPVKHACAHSQSLTSHRADGDPPCLQLDRVARPSHDGPLLSAELVIACCYTRPWTQRRFGCVAWADGED